MKKRLLASLLVFSMLLSMMPMSALAAEYTAEETAATDTQQTEAYTGEVTPDAVASENETPTSTDATAADDSDTASEAVIDEQPTAGGAPIGVGATALTQTGTLQSGAYILKDNIKGDLVIPDGAQVILDLNGHTLTGSDNGSVIVIEKNSKLTIIDNSGTGKGKITGGNGEAVGGGHRAGGGIFNKGYLLLKDGIITENTADNGGGVYNDGAFRMEGGRITNNVAKSHGGGVVPSVNPQSPFVFIGGRIDHNKAWSGGAVYSNLDGEMIMSSPAKIYNNSLTTKDMVKGEGSDLYYATDGFPTNENAPDLSIASPATWGIIGMHSWFLDSTGHRYPDKIGPVPDGKIDNMVTVGKVNTVTFDTDGGLWQDGTTADKNVQLWVDETENQTEYFSLDDGNNVVPKAPEKPGYSFKGWYTAPNGQDAALDTSAKVTKDITYYAAWEENNTQEYTLTYQSNGGSYVPATIHKAGESVDLKAEPTREGYVFAGWCEDEDLTNEITNITMDSDKTVYAAWVKAEFPAQSVTVTFDANGGQWGNGDKTKLVDIARGTAVFKKRFPTNPSRVGYVFAGWTTDDGKEFGPYTIVDENITVKANWKQQHCLTYDPKGGTLNGPTKVYYNPNEEATLTDKISREGFAFKGWYTNEQYSGNPVTKIVMDSDKTVYAKWEQKWLLTYDLQGGQMEGEHSQYCNNGETIDITTKKPTKAGYEFAGWYVKPDYSGDALTKVTMDANKTVYAKWVTAVEKVTITYEFRGDVPPNMTAPEKEEIAKGKEYTPYQYSSDEIPDGWGFKGWFTTSYFSEWSRFTGGVVDKNMTLYGGWYRVANTVTFDANGGQWDGNQTQQVRSVEKNGVIYPYEKDNYASNRMPANPKMEGHTCIGWNTKPDGNGKDFYPGEKVTENITVYAQWDNSREWVHVRYELDDYNNTEQARLPAPSDYHIPSAEKLKMGTRYEAQKAATNEPYWEFDGWYEDERYTKKYEPRELDENLVLYGRWERAFNCQVTYSIPGTEYSKSFTEEYTNEAKPELWLKKCSVYDAFEDHPQSNEIETYLKDKTFQGWKDVETGQIYSEEAVLEVPVTEPAKNYHFEAVLQVVPQGNHVLTYDYQFGDVNPIVFKEVHAAGESVTLRGEVERSGYKFLGWTTRGSDDINPPGKPFNMPNHDETLYAKWERNSDLKVILETYGGTPIPDAYTVKNEDLLQIAKSENPNYKFADETGQFVQFADPTLKEFNFVGWYANTLKAQASVGGLMGMDFKSYLIQKQQQLRLLREKISSGNYTGPELIRLKNEIFELRCEQGYITLADKYNPDIVGFHEELLPKIEYGSEHEAFEKKGLANVPKDGDEWSYDDSILKELYDYSDDFAAEAVEELYLEALYVDKNGDLAFATDVTYDSNNGSGEKVVKEYIETATVPLLNNNPFNNTTKKLLGWNTKPDGTGTHYGLGAKFKVPVGGTTLYAEWEKVVPVQKYTVSYDLNGGVGADGETYDVVEVVKDTVVKAKKAPTKDGYVFKGWSDGNNTYQPDSEIKVSGNVTLTAQWEKKAEPKPTFTVSYDLNGGTGAAGVNYDSVSVTKGENVTAKKAPTKKDYTFKGWSDGKNTYQPGDAISVTGHITLTAQWEKNSSGGGGGSVTKYYVLSYDSNGGTAYKDEKYRKNTVVDLDKVPIRTGYTFTGWYADKGLTDKITSIKMTDDKTVYAGWKGNYIPDDLNSKDHVAYVVGYVDGTVKPNNDVTRAETAAMLYRLLTDERRAEIDTSVNPFSDVKPSDWYAQPVFSMANGQYIAGYEDGTFRGNQSITRAEFVAMLVRFIGAEKAECEFTDVPKNYWAYNDIATATVAGWIGGYPDGSFGPNKKISRAEAMSIINRVLDRGVDADSELLDFKKWPDNPKDSWYYYEIIEATNEHEYTGSRPSEDWTSLSID